MADASSLRGKLDTSLVPHLGSIIMSRSILTILLCGIGCGVGLAQSGGRAVLPDSETLNRLNLKTAWSTAIPVSNRKDGLSRVQCVDDQQIFVQTKTGTLYCLDARTGRELWKYMYPSKFTEGFAVAVNEQFVYSVNVSKLYCHQRFRGVLEFEIALPETPASGPVVDNDVLFIPFTGAKIASYELPPSYRTSAAAKQEAKDRGLVASNPADAVVSRNARNSSTASTKPAEIEEYNVPKAYFESSSEISNGANTPSIATLQTVRPPYVLGGLNKVVSLTMLPSVQPPYTLKPDFLQNNQLSPSIASIPPSVARLYELSNLRPPPFQPKLRWLVSSPAKIYSEPVFAPKTARSDARLWITVDDSTLQAVQRDRREDDVTQQLWTIEGTPSAPMAGPYRCSPDLLLGVIALRDGLVLGIDLNGGNAEQPRYDFRVNVGGFLNHKPVIASDGVYVSGDDAGISRINIKTGEVDWRTSGEVDRVLAVTDETVYAKSSRGQLVAYPKGQASASNRFRAKPIGSFSIADFTFNISNEATDRLLLASDSGLIVCLRDSAAKYAKPNPLALPIVAEKKKPEVVKPMEPTKPDVAKPMEPAKPEKK